MSENKPKVQPITPLDLSPENRALIRKAGTDALAAYKAAVKAAFLADGKSEEVFDATWPNIVSNFGAAIAAASGVAAVLKMGPGTAAIDLPIGGTPQETVKAIMGALDKALGQHASCNDPDCPVHGKGKADDDDGVVLPFQKPAKSYLN